MLTGHGPRAWAAILDWRNRLEHLKSNHSDAISSFTRKEFNVVYCRHILTSLTLALVLASTARSADDSADLKWKFEKGKVFYQTLTTETTQDMKVMGMDVKQKPSQTFWLSWTPVEEKDKSWTLKQKIEGVKMEIEKIGRASCRERV